MTLETFQAISAATAYSQDTLVPQEYPEVQSLNRKFLLHHYLFYDANPPLFPGLGPAQWCAGLRTTEAEEH